jgi:hypothetical protein
VCAARFSKRGAATHLQFELLVGFGNLEDGEEAKEVGQNKANMASN